MTTGKWWLLEIDKSDFLPCKLYSLVERNNEVSTCGKVRIYDNIKCTLRQNLYMTLTFLSLYVPI